jgi:hypothetical protein
MIMSHSCDPVIAGRSGRTLQISLQLHTNPRAVPHRSRDLVLDSSHSPNLHRIMSTDDVEMKDTSSAAAAVAVDHTADGVDGAVAPPQPVHYLDALPYLDVEYASDPNMQEQVKQLLQEGE